MCTVKHSFPLTIIRWTIHWLASSKDFKFSHDKRPGVARLAQLEPTLFDLTYFDSSDRRSHQGEKRVAIGQDMV